MCIDWEWIILELTIIFSQYLNKKIGYNFVMSKKLEMIIIIIVT